MLYNMFFQKKHKKNLTEEDVIIYIEEVLGINLETYIERNCNFLYYDKKKHMIPIVTKNGINVLNTMLTFSKKYDLEVPLLFLRIITKQNFYGTIRSVDFLPSQNYTQLVFTISFTCKHNINNIKKENFCLIHEDEMNYIFVIYEDSLFERLFLYV